MPALLGMRLVLTTVGLVLVVVVIAISGWEQIPVAGLALACGGLLAVVVQHTYAIRSPRSSGSASSVFSSSCAALRSRSRAPARRSRRQPDGVLRHLLLVGLGVLALTLIVIADDPLALALLARR